MTRTAIELACEQQDRASDPLASVFVSASAGSGKTKLLIDRLLRLMLPRVNPDDPAGPLLPGTEPSRILCLTFTKAAAAEMAIRLQRTLGTWVTLPDDRLDMALRTLDVPAAAREQARALFARVLDLPGGMRIGTIHAFCQSLLRRFPLEAAINPHFTLLEDTDAKLALSEAAETELARLPPSVLGPLATQISLSEFTEVLATLKSSAAARPALALVRSDPAALRETVLTALGVDAQSDDPILDACADMPNEDTLRDALNCVATAAADSAKRMAVSMLDWLACHPPERAARWAEWQALFLTGKGEPRKNGGLNKKFLDTYPDASKCLEAEAQRILRVEETRRALSVAGLTLALLSAAAPILETYNARKTLMGQVEYDDLIARTLGLLRDPGAAWVLYKLDGGIDHLLLDEVQDTSRAQWRIAGGLTEEFFVGHSAREAESGPRTVFAVGDYKQSIYGFQGADPEAFRTWRSTFKQRAQNAGLRWAEPELTVSFRSTAPVLSLVDAVFSNPMAARGIAEPGQRMPRHDSARPGQGGRVELWPLVPRLNDDDSDAEQAVDSITPWHAPRKNMGQISPQQRLAETLARWIASELLKPPEAGTAQLLPGDILILVPRRSAFVRALVRALKSADVPVATLVRTELADQTVVQDLMALCDALLLPQDDLTLACVLTSPLGGLTDQSLMRLALDRKGEPLWSVLRDRHQDQPDWTEAWRILSSLFRRVDYASPYELLSETLGAYGGRARLLGRLGPEAGEAIDEVLSAALRFEDAHPPSLQGFLHWLRHSNEAVKREAEASGNAVRVMTAHGSKGLQAKLVILPDTIGTPRTESRLLWFNGNDTSTTLPLFVPRATSATDVTQALSQKLHDMAVQEYNRLLYVALTRASDRLIVCGWEPQKLSEDSWYARCTEGFTAANARGESFNLGWPGERLVIEEQAISRSPTKIGNTNTPQPPIPAWMGRAPSWIPIYPDRDAALARPLSPSRPDDAGMGSRPASRSPLEIAEVTPNAAREAALRRGQLVHALLQFLPDRAPSDRTEAAFQWLMCPGNGLTEAEAGRLVARVLAIIEHPTLTPLFGPNSRAEQRLAGLAETRVIIGQIDRMCVLEDKVLICDFKTNRMPPTRVDRTPVLYLKQMAAYRAVLRNLYPNKKIICSLVWTETQDVNILPDSLMDNIRIQ